MDWKGNPSPRAWWHSFGFNEKVNPTPTPIPKPKPKPKPKPNPNPNPNSIPNPNQEGWREEGFSVAFAPEERQYARQYISVVKVTLGSASACPSAPACGRRVCVRPTAHRA